MDVRVVDPAATRSLRQRVLRPHETVEDLARSDDDAPSIAVFRNGAVVGCASVRPEPMPGSDTEGAWRLRGMASDPAVRGQGYGAAALAAALEIAREGGGVLVWCNARTPARGFYERYGFTAVGEEFELPGVGPHWLMSRSV